MILKFDLEIPDFSLTFYGHDKQKAFTVGGRKLDADVYVYKLEHKTGWHLHIALFQFSNSSIDVRCTRHSEYTPPRLRRLVHGLRMPVYIADQQDEREHLYWSQLSQARPKFDDSSWSNLEKATEKQLDEGAGFGVRKFLIESAGIIDFGTREAVLGHTNNKRNYLCALYKLDPQNAPLACYIITRVLPLTHFDY